MGITTEVVTPEVTVSPLPPSNVTTTIGTTANVNIYHNIATVKK